MSVIVPVHDAGPEFPANVTALLSQDYPPARVEILVVDDGSAVDLAWLAGHAGRVTVLRQDNRGSYSARNTGARAATGEVLAFIDADCRADPGWLRAGVECLRDDACGLAGGDIVREFRDRRSLVEIYDADFHLRQEYLVAFRGFAATANLFVRRAVFHRHGGFDGALRSSGDLEFCRRAVDAGERLCFAAKAVVTHPTRRSFAALRAKVARICGGKGALGPLGLQYVYVRPRPLGAFPPGFHIPEVTALRGLRKLAFVVFYYGVELLRIGHFLRGLVRDYRRR